MKRRYFITSSIMGAGALTIAPTSVLANDRSVTLSGFGKGFNLLSQKTETIAVSSLSNEFVKAYAKISNLLKEQGYQFDPERVTQLNKNCFIIPLHKNPLLGFSSNELAIIVYQNNTYKHYILNEKTTNEFCSFIENFDRNIKGQNLQLDVLALTSPTEVLKHECKKETIFTFKNTLHNTITLKSNSKRSVTMIS